MGSIFTNNHLLTFLILFFWSAILTPLAVKIAERYRILDCPGGRKCHEGVIPRGGGLVVCSGFLVWALGSGILGQNLASVVTGAILVFFVGYLDDLSPVAPLFRLFIHIIAAIMVIRSLEVDLVLKILFLLWVAGMTNAFNLIDGMNGLALTLSSLTTLTALIYRGGPWWSGLLGLCIGILIWNFPKAYTFLGDGGSTLLGFLCSSMLVIDFSFAFYAMSYDKLILCLVLLGGIPVIDTLSAMCRRIWNKKSPFTPDRGHLHHILVDKGLTQQSALLILSFLHLGLVAFGFLLMGIRAIF